MLAAVIALAVVCIALVAALMFVESAHLDEHRATEERHRDERRELTTRIQAPHLVPVPPGAGPKVQQPDRKGMSQVGRVVAPQEGDVA